MPSFDPNTIRSLIGMFAGDKTAQLNQDFIDAQNGKDFPEANPNSGPVDSNGKPLLPYKTPSGWTKFAHPDIANQEQNANNAWQTLEPSARREAAARLAGLTDTVTPAANSIGKDPRVLASGLSLGGETGLNSILEAGLQRTNGTIPARANAALGAAKESGAQSFANLQQDVPNWEAIQRAAHLQYDANTSRADMPNIEPRAKLAGGQIASQSDILPYSTAATIGNAKVQNNENARLLGESSNLDKIYHTGLGTQLVNSQIANYLAQDRGNMIDNLKDTQRAGILGEQFNAKILPASPNPRSNLINTRAGTISTGQRTPGFNPLMSTMTDKIGTPSGNGTVYHGATSNGQPIPAPFSDNSNEIDPNTMKPISRGFTIPPASARQVSPINRTIGSLSFPGTNQGSPINDYRIAGVPMGSKIGQENNGSTIEQLQKRYVELNSKRDKTDEEFEEMRDIAKQLIR